MCTPHRSPDGRDHAARWGLFLFALALTAARTPDLFLEPRLWAEEGSLFLQNAYSHRWYETLFDTPLGYYCFLSSLAATIGARAVSVEWVAHFTTAFALAVQLVPVALIVWGRAPIWRGLGERFLGLCVLLLNPLAEEIWLTTTNLHFYAPLIAFLVLLEPPESETPRGRWVHRGLLVVAGLSGPPACLLAPLFAIEAIRSRRREAFVRAALVGALTVLQLAIAVDAVRHGPVHPGHRFAAVRFSDFSSVVLVCTVVVSFLGRDVGEAVGGFLLHLREQGYDTYGLRGLACALLLGAALLFLDRRAAAPPRWLYLGGFFLLVVPPFYLGIGDRAGWVHFVSGARYFHAPSVVLLWFVLAQLDLRRVASWDMPTRLVAVAFAVGLAVQASELDRRALNCTRTPPWRDEVARWHADPSHRLQICPPGWAVSIPGERARSSIAPNRSGITSSSSSASTAASSSASAR